MSIGDLLPIHFYEVAFLGTFMFIPVIAFRGDLENYFFGALVLYMLIRVIRQRRRTTLPAEGKAVFITGCDSGFGQFTATRLDELGYKVFAGCLFPDGQGAKDLKEKSTDKLHIVPIDVTDDVSVRAAEEYVKENLQDTCLWGLVNNAGMYAHGDIELCTMDTYKRTMDVNLFGMIRVTKQFLPHIRKSKGRIVIMSSINGRFPWPSASAYNMSKYGVECFGDSLRMEMARFEVKVSLVEPAMFGGSTAIHDEKNVSRYYEEIEQSWNECSEEVKAVYTKEYMTNQIEVIVNLRHKVNAKSPDAVIDAVVEGINNSEPNSRYVVHGGPFPLDPVAVYGQLSAFLPEFASDWFACKLTQQNNIKNPSSDSSAAKEKKLE